jgi:hypothetical protein
MKDSLSGGREPWRTTPADFSRPYHKEINFNSHQENSYRKKTLTARPDHNFLLLEILCIPDVKPLV